MHAKRAYYPNVPHQATVTCASHVPQTGNPNVLVCERGTMFGYTDLIVVSAGATLPFVSHIYTLLPCALPGCQPACLTRRA